MTYQTKQAQNGKYLVIDTKANQTVAAGMSQEQAEAWAARLNVRAVWGK